MSDNIKPGPDGWLISNGEKHIEYIGFSKDEIEYLIKLVGFLQSNLFHNNGKEQFPSLLYKLEKIRNISHE